MLLSLPCPSGDNQRAVNEAQGDAAFAGGCARALHMLDDRPKLRGISGRSESQARDQSRKADSHHGKFKHGLTPSLHASGVASPLHIQQVAQTKKGDASGASLLVFHTRNCHRRPTDPHVPCIHHDRRRLIRLFPPQSLMIKDRLARKQVKKAHLAALLRDFWSTRHNVLHKVGVSTLLNNSK